MWLTFIDGTFGGELLGCFVLLCFSFAWLVLLLLVLFGIIFSSPESSCSFKPL